ncbi:MAG: dihydrofolate reductase family protein, partial [Thermoanaerobaculia bacterium]
SSTLTKAEWNNSNIIKGDVATKIRELKQQPGGQILLNGSATLVQSLMKTDLVDEYQFLVHPIIMGSGKRFFKEGMPMRKLRLADMKKLSKGVHLLYYQPA